LGPVGSERRSPANPSLSGNGQLLAIQDSRPSENSDIWVIDLEKGTDTRVTLNPAIDALPVWSPDGTRLVFNSNRSRGTLSAVSDLYTRTTNPDATDEPLLLSDDAKFPSDWSPDGQFILYRSLDSATGTNDLMALPLAGDRKPFPVARTPYDERDGQFAPNGQAIAFHSDESGRPEIYVQAFPQPKAPKTRISVAGGTQPRWRQDGKELFYLGGDNRMMAVSITKWVDGQPVFGSPAALFQTRAVGVTGTLRQQYVVTADGQKFLINVTTDEGTTSPITILLNWHHDS
jgi:Tol biopolymer transport system component